MNIIQDISKKELLEIRDNDVDKCGKRIKVRDANYINLLQHVKRIPSRIFQILPENNLEFKAGDSRAITVKENVLNSITEKGNFVINSDKQEFMSSSVQNANVDEKKDDIIKNVDSYFEEISRERQELLNDRESVNEIIQKVNNSTRLLNDLTLRENEEQKKLEEKQRSLDHINQKIINAIKSQMDTLNETRQKYQSLLEENSRIEMENQQKINLFQSRIDEISQKNLNIEDDIARQQEILNALVNSSGNDDVIDFSRVNDDSDVITRKIA